MDRFVTLFFLFNSIRSYSTEDVPVIVYAVDITSVSAIMVSLHTVFERHSKIEVYVIVCSDSNDTAFENKQIISKSLSCLKGFDIKILSFVHPVNSPLKLSHLSRRGAPHWLSDTETVRLLIPDIIPSLKKFIYLDNDIIITKYGILGDLWKRKPKENSSVSLAMDSLTDPEIAMILKSYFNASAPLLNRYFPAKEFFDVNMTLDKLTRQFASIIPRFPNNGVMLVDAERWRALNLSGQFLSLAQDCKHAEERGEEHVAWGSQPASIVILRKHWSELPQVRITDILVFQIL